MDTLTLRPRRFTASSSQLVEELAGPSGLPAQGSIAGGLSLRRQPQQWSASLERLGQERSRLEQLPSDLPAAVYQELTSALSKNVWVAEVVYPGSCGDCMFLTGARLVSGLVSAPGHVYLFNLKRTDPGVAEATKPQERATETCGQIVPDTDRAYGFRQMAHAWEAIGQPVTEDDVPLTVDPDDFSLF